MKFCLKNAPDIFQRTPDHILKMYKWKDCIVYLDGVIIFSNSIEEHIRHVDDIFTALGKVEVKLKLSK